MRSGCHNITYVTCHGCFCQDNQFGHHFSTRYKQGCKCKIHCNIRQQCILLHCKCDTSHHDDTDSKLLCHGSPASIEVRRHGFVPNLKGHVLYSPCSPPDTGSKVYYRFSSSLIIFFVPLCSHLEDWWLPQKLLCPL